MLSLAQSAVHSSRVWLRCNGLSPAACPDTTDIKGTAIPATQTAKNVHFKNSFRCMDAHMHTCMLQFQSAW